MHITDPIADMLTRIRNANSAKHETVDIPASNMKKAIAQILLDEGYIASYKVIEDDKGNEKHSTVKYLVEGEDLEDTISVIRSYLIGENENYWWFLSIQETPIQEVVLSYLTI